MLTDILSSSLLTADLYLALIQLNKALRIFKHMLNNPILKLITFPLPS